MKYLIMLIFTGIVFALINGCNKESSIIKSSKSVDNSSIEGTWELRQLTGDIGTIDYNA